MLNENNKKEIHKYSVILTGIIFIGAIYFMILSIMHELYLETINEPLIPNFEENGK